MSEDEIGKILAAQLLATVRHKELSYVSTIGTQYCHLTDDGKRVMAELIDMMFTKAVECEQRRIKNAAEKMMMDNLKS